MGNDGSKTEKGRPAAPFGHEDTLAAPLPAAVADTVAPVDQPSASRSLPALDRQRYQVVSEVGRGGLGRILSARDLYLDRPVAVKELLDRGGGVDDGARARFVREALITARLQHPAIVPIYDAGQSDDDGPFYAMKLVAGKSLAEVLLDKHTLAARLAYLPSVIAVVDAMAYAHDAKIIHRDLKPQNVLVGDYGETVLIDWGLAKDLAAAEVAQRADASEPAARAASSSTETIDGAVMGTPAFMPPEQAAGEDVDERADVYALGAMLYFVIAGTPPHTGRSMDDMLLKIVTGAIVPVQEHEPRCPADLAAIVAKAMAKERGDRYRTAGALSEDLKKFQTGQLVGAYQYTLGDRLRRWLSRHARVVGVAAIALVILVAYGIWSIQQIRERRAEAERAAALAQDNEREANKQRDAVVAQSMLVRARQYAATGHTAEEIAVLRALARPDAGAASRKLAIEDGGLIWKAHQRLAMALGSEVGLALRSADGARFVATVPGALVSWDVVTGQELARLAIETPDQAAARFGKVLAISPTGRFAIVVACKQPGAGCGLEVSDGGNTLAPRTDTELALREIATGDVVVNWVGDGSRLDRRTLAFAADDSAIGLRVGARVELHPTTGTGRHAVAIAATCVGSFTVASPTSFAIGCTDRVVLYRDGKTTEILRGPPPSRLVFTAPDRLLAIGEGVRLWDAARGELRGEGALSQPEISQRDEDETEELPWSYYRPGVDRKASRDESTATQIRVGHTSSIIPRTSIISPPPRITGDGAVVTLEGSNWQALVLHGDFARYALVDQLVPAEPPERCLSRIGGERHATTVLDNGDRLLVDQQEVALGLDLAPPEGYRHTTTAEVPVRQLRPLVAAETDACLVWGMAVGATARDGGPIAPLSGVADDGDGGLVVAGAHEGVRIDRAGTRTPIATGGNPPVISPTGTHVAALDPIAHTVTITDVASGAVTRTWTAPATATPRLEWITATALWGYDHLLSTDPAVSPRAYAGDLTSDPRSPFAAAVVGDAVVVVRVADGQEVARHAGAVDRVWIVPDASGSVVLEHAGELVLVERTGQRRALARLPGPIKGVDVAPGLLVAHEDARSDAWDVATGQRVAIPEDANLVAILDDVWWTLEGPRRTRLVRAKRDGRDRREVALATAGLPFVRTVDEVVISPDRRHLTARYAVTEELFAYAMWDADTGVLVWVGPPTASVVGDWIISAGRAYVPAFDVDAVLRDSGARTNLRVCRPDLRVIAVTPPPPPDTYWAPPGACAAAAPRR